VTRLQAREGKLSFFLLLIMLLSLTWSIQVAGWVEGLWVVEWTVLGGLAVGFVMTRIGWPRFFRHLVSVLVAAVVIFAAMARFVGPGLGWRDGVSLLAYQFDGWLRIVAAGEPGTDPAMFVLLMTLVGWWVAYVSAWMVFGTHKVWQALALTLGAMLLIAYGSSSKVVPFFVLYLFCALLLAVRMFAYAQEKTWDVEKAQYDRDIRLYFLRDGGLLVAVVLAAVWLVPLLSSSSLLSDLWGRVEGPWKAVGDEWNRVFSGVQGYRQDYANVPFGGELSLGGPVDLGDEIVMWVDSEVGRYWRGAVYDRYDGSGWENTDTLDALIPADKALPLEGQYELRRLVKQTVVPNWSGYGQLFAVGQPVAVDIPLEVRYSFADTERAEGRDPFSAPASVTVIRSGVPVARDRPYTIVSSVSVADVGSLQEARDDYPGWVAGRYLQLPSSLPERIRELAEEIAGPHDNAYDKADAIQAYLRRMIEYNQDVDRPPDNRDAIDYLLFDSHEGYCNYYASAMVVLARSVGIPSRLAVGYGGGEFDDETGLYAVRERDTHAWVEVYFPQYGWVEFEPTASEQPVPRPGRSEDSTPEGPGSDLDSTLERDLERLRGEEEGIGGPGVTSRMQGTSSSLPTILGGIAVLASAAAAVFVWLIKWRTPQGASYVGRIYRRMCRYSRLMGVRGKASQTPYEYAAVLEENIPSGAPMVERIASLYVRDRFAPGGLDPSGEEQADGAWKGLRPLMRRELVRRVPVLLRSRLRWRWPR
jgi:transglutaminase-like putative cysteine protease